jgi:predicted NUDIX family phosphoesterase
LLEETFLDAVSTIAPRWLPRSQAERDPAFKQWIPYVLLEDGSGALANYPRNGTEARLHGRHSLGLGGHVNPCDAPAAVPPTASYAWWREVLWRGMRRELSEEFPAALEGTTRLLGLVNEDTGPVGLVHLGIVFHHRLDESAPTPPEGELEGLRWLPRESIGADPWTLDRFESWSRLALTLLPPSA